MLNVDYISTLSNKCCTRVINRMILRVLLKRIFFFFFRKRIVQVYMLTMYVFIRQVKEKLDPEGVVWSTRMTVSKTSEKYFA